MNLKVIRRFNLARTMVLLTHNEPKEAQDGNYSFDNSKDFAGNGSIHPGLGKGVSVVWRNLTATAEIKKQRLFKVSQKSYKSVIHNVSGAIYPGNLVAIMGISGAGKTTLMSMLSNRVPSGFRVKGDVRINCQSIEKVDKRVFGYVYQDDLFVPSLTVLEHLTFVARLRLDRNIDEKDRQELILKILRDIGLSELVNRRIGNLNSAKQKTSLSGGERKRLSIATELLTEPMLLFCDEPTTGLDSFTALKIITILKSLAVNRNKTIICSIHQPNQPIFQLFNQIILLSQGRIIFNGSHEEAKQFFQSQGYQYDDGTNSAEYFIKSIAIEENKKTCPTESLHFIFSQSEYSLKIEKYVNNVMQQTHSEPHKCNENYKSQAPSWFSRFFTVTHRNFVEIRRNSRIQKMRITIKTLIGISLGLCLHGSITKTQPGLKAFQGVVYVLLNQHCYVPFSRSMSQIPDSLPLFYREYPNNSVTPSMFYLSSVVTTLPFGVAEPLLYFLVICYLAGLRSSAYAVIMSSIVNILLYNTSWAFGVLFTVIFENQLIALSYGLPTMVTITICCGLFIKLSSLPFFISWITYISWCISACAAMYKIQFNDVDNIECESNVNIPCLRTGQEVLKSLDYDKHSLSYDLTMIVLICLIFHVAAFVRLLFKIKRRMT